MTTFVKLAFLSLLVALATPLYAADQPTRGDILFATVDGQELKFDLYMPANVARPPLLIWVHGGGWSGGRRADPNPIALTREGYAIASIDYRLSTVAKFPAQVHDIKAAVRFLRAHAAEYGYDGARIGAMGSSAGAHLAILAGVTNGSAAHEGNVGTDLNQSSAIQAIVSYYGASNLTTILKQSTPEGRADRATGLDLLLGGSPEARAELARLASPIFHVDASDPPLLLLHGDQDPQIPINQSHEIHGAYKAKNLPVAFEVIYGGVHGGPPFYDAERTALVKAFLDRTLRAAR